MLKTLKIALAGNPNAGKTSIFNALTGLRQRVGNFPGVTVDRKSGIMKLSRKVHASLVDLPGTYSLYPKAGDEEIASRVLLNPEDPDHPDVVLLVADATNLRRSMLLCTQVMDLGLPVVLVLNMSDLLESNGLHLDMALLQRKLGIPVVRMSALKNQGLKGLKNVLLGEIAASNRPFFKVPSGFDAALAPIRATYGLDEPYKAWFLGLHPHAGKWLKPELEAATPLENASSLLGNEMAIRYDKIDEILGEVMVDPPESIGNFAEKLDRVLLHPIAGYAIFTAILLLIFQAIFAWASYPMELIDTGFGWSGEALRGLLGDGFLSSLLVDGIWTGLGGIVIFVPQIALLFFFISLLEDSGYMSRVVFLMDRIVRPFGFSGKSVIPLIGGMACAVPSIMMARSIPNKVERMITIMVTPLMSCSARIPVYVLLIGFFVPEDASLWIFNAQGFVLGGMYLLGFLMALLVAWIIKTVSRYKSTGQFVTELPIYRVPRWGNTVMDMYQKSATFVWEAGKVIMIVSIVLWLMSSYGPADEFAAAEAKWDAQIEVVANNPAGPSAVDAKLEAQLRQPMQNAWMYSSFEASFSGLWGDLEVIDSLKDRKASALLDASYAGMVGKAIEPLITPLGFDWKIGISLVTSFAAREVFVSTMATIYSAGADAADDEEGRYAGLRNKMISATREDGSPMYSTAVALSLLVFYAFAMQCMSTLAVVRKETRSWKLTGIMLVYMTGLAYLASFIVYQVMA